jgi:tRNA-splicing ligase RtcB
LLLIKNEKIESFMKIIETASHPIKAWTDYVKIEAEAEEQLKKLASLPFIFKYIAVMPDVHLGKGATVGTVIATEKHLIPAAVGVDIGCGMMAVKLPFKIDKLHHLHMLRQSIERSIPVGNNSHKKPLDYLKKVKHLFRKDVDEKTWLQFGTLGGGNHFIEVSKDQNNDVWAIVHSGSRGIGHFLATKHIQEAKHSLGEKIHSLPDPDLAYFEQGTKEFENYVKDLIWAQQYASLNRQAMMELILKNISFHVFNEKKDFLDTASYVINCHHNYSQIEEHFGKKVWITRKGAVSAKQGELGIIPGSMGEKTYIVKGKGNPESFFSCSHGAGRIMSRTRAKKNFTVEDLKNQTLGIECRKDIGVLDEIPSAYKNINDVMRSQSDRVEIIFTLNQLICIKG